MTARTNVFFVVVQWSWSSIIYQPSLIGLYRVVNYLFGNKYHSNPNVVLLAVFAFYPVPIHREIQETKNTAVTVFL